MSATTTFTDALVAWLNARFVKGGASAIEADTPLFAPGRLNSMRILELIAWTERAIGRAIPDTEIRMDTFRTPRAIAARFAPDGTGGADA